MKAIAYKTPGSIECEDTHHRNESRWKPREVPLDDGRILVLDAD